MTREHLSPARGPVRTGLGAIALAAALAMATSACQSSSKASVVGQDSTTSAAAVGGAGTTTSSSAAATSKSSAPAAGGAFKIGQQVKVGAYTVTVHKVTYPYTNDLDQPDAGKAYVLLDVEVTNSSGDSQAFSSMLQLGLKDSTNHTYDETIVMGVDGNPPDGNIAAGKSLRGPVAFEVPAGSKGLQFSFMPDLGSDKTYIDLGE
ncbi:hypothetical protein ABH935_005652 [Catenulispora sp. GAS73]|uniref:DUF4352 domain-containing protein n=1 Tax=Catenulispora sp. GAS73 TaxID=3156269 RepID=UPI003518F2DC